jgi:hypothetical protein
MMQDEGEALACSILVEFQRKGVEPCVAFVAVTDCFIAFMKQQVKRGQYTISDIDDILTAVRQDILYGENLTSDSTTPE